YARPGSALLEEALVRGSSVYFPGFSVPMLPRELSEGIVSLNEDALRRALVFVVDLDEHAGVTSHSLVGARVRSRRKLTLRGVGGFLLAPEGSPLSGTEIADSVRLFGEVGAARAKHEDRRKMVQYRRVESTVTLAKNGSLAIRSGDRGASERATEQISILCNA